MKESASNVLKILDAAEGPVTGEAIATALGIPRSSVGREIRDLRALGYDISSSKEGYAVLHRTTRLLPHEIKRRLTTQFIGRTIVYHERTASTTGVGRELIAAGEAADLHGAVIIAEEQTGGVGRLGRAWVSPPGGLWFTLILRPSIPIDHMFMVTMAGAIAVVRAIRKECGIGALIKWPNDILIGDKKVAGLLLELSEKTEGTRYCLLGIGIDANVPLHELSAGLRMQVTSLAAELGHDIDRASLLATVLKEVERHYLLLESQEYESIVREWKSLSCTLERRVRISTLTKTFEGDAIDIDEFGALIVRKDNGTVERVIAGDCLHV